MNFITPELNTLPVPFKNPSLKLVGTDGNAFALMGRAAAHNRKHKIYEPEMMKLILKECMAENYDHLLFTLSYFFKVK